MCRHSLLVVIPLLLPLACAKPASSAASSEPSHSEPAPAPVEQPSEVDEVDEVEEADEDTELDELDEEMSDEELAALEAEMDAELEAEGPPGGGFGGRGTKVPSVRQAAATVEGNLDKDIVRRIVRAHINEIRSCYNAGLRKDESLAGKVTIEFTIAADGFVNATKVADSELADATVGECMAKAVGKWQFPKPTGGGEVRVVYPFLLETE